MKKYENRIVIVTRTTRLENVLESQNTVSQARFYVKQLGSDFGDYEEEHRQYSESLKLVRRDLEELGNVQMLDRKFLPNFIFAPNDMVLVVGQDGLVVNTLKYLTGQPVIGVNPDASRWDGVLLPFKPVDAGKILEETIRGKRRIENVTIAKARVQNGQELLAVNDFFVGHKTHASARYVIKYGGLKENQSSSGIIVSTGLGSTGWMKSIIAGSSRLNASIIGTPYGASQERDDLTKVDDDDKEKAGVYFLKEHASAEEKEYKGKALWQALAPIPSGAGPARMGMERRRSREPEYFIEIKDKIKKEARLSGKKKTFGHSELSSVVGKWASTELLFAVREPFPSKTTGTNLVFGTVSPKAPLRIESLMGENGIIFSDGVEDDFIAFNSGTEVEITLADKRGKMVV